MGVNKVLNDVIDILPDHADKPIYKTLKQYAISKPDDKIVARNAKHHAEKLKNTSLKLQFLEKNLAVCLKNHLIKDLVKVVFHTPEYRKDLVKDVMHDVKKGKDLEQSFFENLVNEIAAYKKYADRLEHKFVKYVVKPSINIGAVRFFEWEKDGQKFAQITPALTKEEYSHIFKDSAVLLGIAKTVATTPLTEAIVDYMEYAKDAKYDFDPTFLEKNDYSRDITALIAEIKAESDGA